MYNFEIQFDENLMFKDNFESRKAISVCCRIISFVPKYIFSVSGYRHVALLILFYMKKKRKTLKITWI